MTASFVLSVSPWIPCEDVQGQPVLLSTYDALARAHELRGIVHESPLVLAAVHRHLLAIVHRAYEGPRSIAEWLAIASAGRFDEGRLRRYLDAWSHRLDLFHPESPFAQTRGLAQQFDVTPIDELELERSPWGGARELFRHRPEDTRARFDAPRAALALLAHQAFATGGLVKKPGEPTSATAAPLTKSAVVLLTGTNLFETLRANLLVYDPGHALPVPARDDAPSWELDPPPRSLPVAKEPTVAPRGWIHLLTWLSRRIELVSDERGVSGFIRCVYAGFPENPPLDPMVTYRRDDKRGLVPLGINPDRAFWRNANVLFESSYDDATRGKYLRPRTIAQASTREVHGVLGREARFRILLLGVATDQSRVEALRAESLVAHAGLFTDPTVGQTIERALGHAESGVAALREALFVYARHALSPGARSPDTKDVRRLSDSFQAGPSAWSSLGEAFQVFVRDLAEDADRAEQMFAQAVIDIARAELQRATSRADATAGWLKALAHASARLERALRPVVRAANPPAPEPEEIHA